MPLAPGKSPSVVSRNIGEFHTGKTYAHTAEKFGKERANEQAIAVALSNARRHPRRADGGVMPLPQAASLRALGQGIAPSSPASAAVMMGRPGMTVQTPNPLSAAPSAVLGVGPSGGFLMPPQNLPRKHGGPAQRADGGFGMPLRPLGERRLHVGPVLSTVPGRVDRHRVSVPAGSYVLPAQHIASLGQGNSLAGMSVASKMFGAPYETKPMGIRHGHLPRPPRMGRIPEFSEGGARGEHSFRPVPVDISGGEFVIPPWAIIRKFGSLDRGFKILDKWIMDTRAKEIKTQKKLPPPAKK